MSTSGGGANPAAVSLPAYRRYDTRAAAAPSWRLARRYHGVRSAAAPGRRGLSGSIRIAAAQAHAGLIMALKIELKPYERIIIGESLITNSDQRTRFLIDGNAPILREKDILTSETANTPVKRIYLCVQMMYLENDIAKYQELYFEFVKDVLAAMPSSRKQVEAASNHILSGAFYKALKDIRKLMAREAELLKQKT
jgi:flagellar biosynthesis repressor protein FlbT